LKLTIDSVIRLQDVPEKLLKQIKAELTMRNPEFDKKRRMGLNRWAWGPELIKLWSEKKVNASTEYILPRGYFARLWNLAGLSWDQVDDQRFRLPEIEFPARPQLRDYQEPAVQLARDWQQGVMIAPCGSGKTASGMGMIAEVRQPTLWIAHREDLLTQAMDSAKKFLGLNESHFGLIQGDKMEIGTHITFATVQTLYKRDLGDIRNSFGCVVVDECHLCFADFFKQEWDKKTKQTVEKGRMFESVIRQIPAYYRFGLTASEYRSDGLITTMFHIMGPKFYEVSQDDSRLTVMKPKVIFVETGFEFHMPAHIEKDEETGEEEEKEDNLSVAQMYKAMREDQLRNSRIEDIFAFKYTDGDCFLCLGDSLEHLKEAQFIAQTYNYAAAFICGETPKKERDLIMTKMRAGEYQFLFATYALAKLGLDIPRLNKLVLITPHKDRTSVQQAVGRIMRPFEGKKQPVVYDFWDNKVKQCNGWARERAKVYLGLGCEVVGGPKVRGGRKP
jgi:superfamily II DNA or RNA helicase